MQLRLQPRPIIRAEAPQLLHDVLDVRSGDQARLAAQEDALPRAPGVRLPADVQVDVTEESSLGLGEEAGGDVFGQECQ